MKPLDIAQLGCRITVPLLFLFAVGSEILAQGRPNIALSVIAGLISIFAIWMLFGVRTRVATLAALVLWTGWLALGGSSTEQLLIFSAIAALSLPLIIAGGGSRAMYRRGWSDIV